MSPDLRLAPNKDFVSKLVLRSFIGSFNLLCMFWSVLLIDIHTVTILKNSTAMFTMLLSYIFLNESITVSKFLSFVICIFGIILIVDPNIIAAEFHVEGVTVKTFIGSLLMIAWSFNSALIKIILKKSTLRSWKLRPKSEQLLLRRGIDDNGRSRHDFYGRGR